MADETLYEELEGELVVEQTLEGELSVGDFMYVSGEEFKNIVDQKVQHYLDANNFVGRLERLETGVYKVGDTVNLASDLGYGFLTSGSKNLQIDLPLVKPTGSDITRVTYSNLKIAVRNNGVYLNNNGNDGELVPSSHITVNGAYLRNVGVGFSMTLSDIVSGSLNNSPIMVTFVSGTLTFS